MSLFFKIIVNVVGISIGKMVLKWQKSKSLTTFATLIPFSLLNETMMYFVHNGILLLLFAITRYSTKTVNLTDYDSNNPRYSKTHVRIS